jgi:hypothetical protein
LFICPLLALSFGVPKALASAHFEWSHELVSAQRSNAPLVRSSLALTSGGNPVVAFHNEAQNRLTVGTRTNGVWSYENPINSNSGAFVSLAIDSNNAPHVAFGLASGFFDNVGRYTVKNGANWQTSGNIGAPLSTESISLDLTTTNLPRIAYSNGSALSYLVNDGISWTSEAVASSFAINNSVLKLDSKNNPWIAFNDSGALKLASRSGGVWGTQTIVASGVGVLSFALTSDDRPKLAFRGTENLSGLHYAEQSGETWSFQLIDSRAGASLSQVAVSLALNSLDQPGVAYRDTAVRYAERIGGNWESGILPGSTFTAASPSLVFGASDTPYVSYQAFMDATGTSGVFLATGSVIPEPSVWLLFVCAMGICLFLRKRRTSQQQTFKSCASETHPEFHLRSSGLFAAEVNSATVKYANRT